MIDPMIDPMIDSHCHLDSPRFGDAGEQLTVLEAAADAGLTHLVIPGVYPAGWDALRALETRGHPRLRLHACYGIHPQVVPELSDGQIADAMDRLSHEVGLLGPAIGECGIDGPTAQLPGGDLERQLEVLTAHLEIAERLEKPIILHCLRTHEPLLKLLRARGGVSHGAILHSYSGSAEQVREYLELNCWFSFAGPISYYNARRPVLAARAVPLDRLLVETDAPDQTPEPHRGQRNEPAFLPAVIAGLARARGVDVSEITAATTRNARELLRLEAPI